MGEPKKIIIDTDPGIDDAMAIFLALKSPEINVIGLTTIFGNVYTTLATRNALHLLEFAGRSDIPVVEGSHVSYMKATKLRVADFVHGVDGLGNQNFPQPKSKPIENKSAAEYLVEQASLYPGEVTVVALGPLTNIALAIELDPAFVKNIGQIVLLGGAFAVNGNVNPASEANIFGDPEAADIVFTSGADVLAVGLNVTHQVILHVPNFGIEALTGANFTSWKDQLYLTLGMLDYDYAIRHDEPAALTVESAAAQKANYEKWERANRLSLMMVKNSIHPSIRGAIPDNDKVRTYLQSVEDHFKGSSKATASSLMLQMLTLKYEGSSGVREHIMKMVDMSHKLKNLEMEVSDNFLVHFIMTSLPARFDTFKVNYNAMKDKWSISELIAMCVQEEDRLKHIQPEAVHLTTTSNSRKRKGNYSNKTENKVQNHGAATSGPKSSTGNPNCKFRRTKGHGQKDCSKFKDWLAKKGIPYNPEASKGPMKT